MKFDELLIVAIIFLGFAILVAQAAIYFHKTDRIERCLDNVGNLDYCNRIYK